MSVISKAEKKPSVKTEKKITVEDLTSEGKFIMNSYEKVKISLHTFEF